VGKTVTTSKCFGCGKRSRFTQRALPSRLEQPGSTMPARTKPIVVPLPDRRVPAFQRELSWVRSDTA
jgi:hypothetical protein